MLKCRELSSLVSTGELENAGWMKRLEIRMHVMMCGHCRRYLAQMRALGLGARHLIRGKQADPEQLERMKQEVINQCCPHDPDHGGPES
jgi:anti-sigma factor ChrR (cupin superfamily)